MLGIKSSAELSASHSPTHAGAVAELQMPSTVGLTLYRADRAEQFHKGIPSGHIIITRKPKQSVYKPVNQCCLQRTWLVRSIAHKNKQPVLAQHQAQQNAKPRKHGDSIV